MFLLKLLDENGWFVEKNYQTLKMSKKHPG
jgi:hypothetical protein